jgi:hypothetical protein
MIVFDRVFCDCCHAYMGQLWNQPAAAPDLLPAPDFRVCDDCHLSAIPEQERNQWPTSA